MIANGSMVTMHYTLTVDGQVVDSSRGGTPLEYVQGGGQIIPGLEEQLEGLKTGDVKKVEVGPEKGYGPVNPDALQVVPKSAIENPGAIAVGAILDGQIGGQPVQATVVKVDGDNFTVDLNHPLAGKTLLFDVEIMDVKAGN